MIQQVKKSKFKKTIATYLAMMILLETLHPMQMYALTSGPTQPEFTAFTPIGTSDMVDLASGDFNYNIPIMDVGGYPLNLAYDSGVTMDQEASWVGLGWNLNVGQITRQMRGLPDDFNGDKMIYENDLRDNVTVGASFSFHPATFGKDKVRKKGPLSYGIGVQYNNYEGISFKPTFGVTYELSKNVSVGANFSSSVGEGPSVSPSVSISSQLKDRGTTSTQLKGNFGVSLSSRKGLENISLSATSNNSIQLKNDKNVKRISTQGNIGAGYSINNQSYTPTKRIGFQNKSVTFDAALGSEVVGAEQQGQITAYGSYQSIRSDYKFREVSAYGYENSQYKNNQEGVMDFNREKEQIISPSTNVLPVTNYTYDIYSIQGQGIGGMFRPYRSQISYVYNDNVVDNGTSDSFGFEIGGGGLFHGGLNFNTTPTSSRTGLWKDGNNVLPYFNESNNDANKIDYESFTFKLIGETNVDIDADYNSKLHVGRPLRFELSGESYAWNTSAEFTTNKIDTNPISHYNIDDKIKRKNRLQRNQTVQKITRSQVETFKDPMINVNQNAKSHHTAGIKILQPGGSSYIYGETVYNTKKVEATFDVSGGGVINTSDETISYNGNVRGNGNENSDHYVNKITTPQYAHTYLLTSILSADYEDVDNNGPSDNDLGNYTRFDYVLTENNYKWRVPYSNVSYNEGLKTNENDQKGTYLYGEKELKYIKKIETKTHVAYFYLQNRNDAVGVNGQEGSMGTTKMQCIKFIRLYSKSELKAANINITNGPAENDVSVKPIKTAFFSYSYKLCKNTPSNGVGEKGKLTLEKVYFTYKNSNMGKFTPYVFEYSSINPDYNIKANDIWGNYKPLTINPTTSEFPFVDQDKTLVNLNETKADQYASAWALKSVQLPSGGKITINTESDDYQYVQNKKAMQMFKIVGAGNSETSISHSSELYDRSPRDHKDFIYAKINNYTSSGLTSAEIIDKYISNIGREIYFRFLLNMTSDKSDYVSGYFTTKEADKFKLITNSEGTFLAIPVGAIHMGGGAEANNKVNPITKAGWSFGRTYLNRYVYSLGGDEVNKDFESIVKDLAGSISSISQLYTGPNKALEIKGCSRNFNTECSWVRLNSPDGSKYGGGLRVKSVELSDNWDVMTNNANDPSNIYKEKYGQQYNYDLEDGTSSGVATFEPNESPENPFVKPFYSPEGSFADALESRKYVEEPFGENFFPSPTVTYSRITVSNLDRTNQNGDKKLIKHATGKVVTTHYTTKDFPTLVSYTPLDLKNDSSESNIANILNIWSINHITGTQGFAIETNDMNGKVNEVMVYAEGQDDPISSVKNNYNVDKDGKLNNNLTTINSKGEVKTNLIGVTYDLITDFNESNTTSETVGVSTNLASFLVAALPAFVPVPLPTYAAHENILRTATTTKVIHRTGILVEKIAYDIGARVSTKNLAWDAGSGELLLTETVNEYDDHYFSFNYPAYWKYDGMGMACNNIAIEGELTRNKLCPFDPTPHFKVFNPENRSESLSNLTKLFHVGDELMLEVKEGSPQTIFKAWILGFNDSKTGMLLMDKNGNYIDNCGENESVYKFTLVRSGYRNMQTASMATVTSMINPIDKDNDPATVADNITDTTFGYQAGSSLNWRVINASAVAFKDFWKPQDEAALFSYPIVTNANPALLGEVIHPYETGYNPYLFNTKGDWKPEKSYAYLTGRNVTSAQINNPRNEGFYTRFNPFYHITPSGWVLDDANWTYASSVTQYSPFGAELENKDALDRYSAAQYGYNYTMPMAVASNSKYAQIGFEGFEEAQVITPNKHFGFKKGTTYLPVTLSSDQSHTGKRSVKVTKETPVKLVRKLKPLVKNAELRACTYNCNILKIDFVDRNFTFPQCTFDDEVEYFNRYKLSTNCTTQLALTINEAYLPTPVPGELNSIYITIKGIAPDVNEVPPGTTPVTEATIEVFVDGQKLNLRYYYPQKVKVVGQDNVCKNKLGGLICP